MIRARSPAIEVVELLRQLVGIDSRSPGSLQSPPAAITHSEEKICRFVQDWLEGHGFHSVVQEPAPHRPGLIAWHGDDPHRPTLAFEAHFDTVGIEGMTVPPFTAEIRDGRMYGRGTADTKGAMAAMLTALARLRTGNLPLNLVFIGASAEETGCEGAPLLQLDRWKIDGIIVGEPTGNQPIIGHKAHHWIELICRGRAAHGSNPQAGDNAIYKMAEIVSFIRREIEPVFAQASKPGFSPQTVAVTLIQGGTKVNIIPEHCAIQLDLRLHPQAAAAAAAEAVAEQVRRGTGIPVELGWCHYSPGLDLKPESRLYHALAKGLQANGLNPAPAAVNYCTDAGIFSARGYDTLVFGPGNILQGHSADEFVDLAQVEQACRILEATARAFAGEA